MFFDILLLKRVGESLTYGKSESAIFFLNVWINFVEKLKQAENIWLVSFVWKKTLLLRDRLIWVVYEITVWIYKK